jgi:phosphoribosylformylglycinamidine cyclo-ligase
MGFAFIVPKESVETVLSMVEGSKVVGRVIEEHKVTLKGVEVN